ncbi:MAG: hypothetical protein JO056_08960 [Alphaproteobacteria bacterium]|nr:hypothetical protein [Alphaproteobacteria bacterium]
MKYISILASAVCALALSGAATHAGIVKLPHNVGAPKAQGIVGTWLASYNGGERNAIAQWQAGGTSSQLVDFASRTGNALLGDWKKNDDGSFSVFLTGWTFNNKGNKLTGYFTKAETETLSGDTYSGMLHVTFYDLDGNIVFQADGTVSATRISAQ